MSRRAALEPLLTQLRDLPLAAVRDHASRSRDALILQTQIVETLGCAEDGLLWRCPPILTSIDAALTLAERLGWTLDSMGVDTDGICWCQLRRGHKGGVRMVAEIFALHYPLAILAALLAGEIEATSPLGRAAAVD